MTACCSSGATATARRGSRPPARRPRGPPRSSSPTRSIPDSKDGPGLGTLRLWIGGAAPVTLAYATGIGALVALELRARGALGIPLVLQGPVLWGLESRWMPRLARGGLAPVLGRALRSPVVLRAVWQRHFLEPVPAERLHELIDGYRRCSVVGDLFRWLDPAFLHALRARLTAQPAALERIEVWFGDRDRVVGPAEVRATEHALGVTWPCRTFPGWGHYPMFDDPEGWVQALAAK